MSSSKEFDTEATARYERGRAFALHLFKLAYQNIPAYNDFINKEGIDVGKIKTYEDFQAYVTPVNKDNYLRKYEPKALAWKGNLFSTSMISVSSGSSGEPFFWNRSTVQHEEAGEYHYDIYRSIMKADKESTLVVVCFSMGTWIAGPYTTFASVYAADKGLKLNIITPGIEIRDALSAIQKLYANYDQILLAGYPPLIKDLIDQGRVLGIDWSKLVLKYLVAGEAISEELRDYLWQTGKDGSPFDVVNVYGTADAGLIAHETPISISLRRSIIGSGTDTESLFGRAVMPTLAQFNPERRFVEIIDDHIVFTANSGIPLIRYDIKDEGGIMLGLDKFDDYRDGINDVRHQIRDVDKWSLPFVYVHGRADFTASLYAVLIYPENIKTALFSPQLQMNGLVTGKFRMTTEHTNKLDQYLEIAVELQFGIVSDDETENKVRDIIHLTLLDKNAEYRKLHNSLGDKVIPRVILYAYEDPTFFKLANKHKWKG